MVMHVPTDDATEAQIDRSQLVPGARLHGASLEGVDLGVGPIYPAQTCAAPGR